MLRSADVIFSQESFFYIHIFCHFDVICSAASLCSLGLVGCLPFVAVTQI